MSEVSERLAVKVAACEARGGYGTLGELSDLRALLLEHQRREALLMAAIGWLARPVPPDEEDNRTISALVDAIEAEIAGPLSAKDPAAG